MAQSEPRGWLSGSLLGKCVGISILGGSVVGPGAFLFVQASSCGDWGLLANWPAWVIFAIPVAVPFAAVSGTVAAVLLEVLLRSRLRPSSLRGWLGLGGTVGLALGGTCPVFLQATGFTIQGVSEVAQWVGTGASAGACSGFLLGWLGWAEYRKRPPCAQGLGDA